MRLTAPAASGVPSFVPRALAAASAALVRSEIASRSCSANVNGQLVGVGVIDHHELDPRFHQRRDEGEIPGQPIEFRNNELCPLSAARLKGARQLGAIGSLTAFDLDELAGNFPRAAVEEIAHGFLLR
jgi:hypothetical protein